MFEFDLEHSPVAPGALELQRDITRAIALESFVGDRRTGDVPAQAFELLALMRAAAHPGMQAEAVRIGAQGCGAFSSRPGTVRRLCTF